MRLAQCLTSKLSVISEASTAFTNNNYIYIYIYTYVLRNFGCEYLQIKNRKSKLWRYCSPEWKTVSTRTFLALMNRPICSRSPRLTISWKMMSLGKCTVLLAGVTGITGAGFSCACVPHVELYRDPLLYEGTYADAGL